ncbi:MAG: hypothetical protein RIM99_10910 [Cyclobacteriaceae bacterium]
MKTIFPHIASEISSIVIPPFLKGVRGILILLVILSSCQPPDYLSQKELQNYIQDTSNGLSDEQEAGSLTMKVSYRPNDFLIWQEAEGKELADINEIGERYGDYAYFVLQLKAGKKDALYGTSASQAEFNNKLQTLSFRMNQFVNMTTSEKDTIPVADFYYTRMFGLSKTSDILFVFNKEKISAADEVAFNIKEFGFNTGSRSFRFDTEKLNRSPKLLELKSYYETH